MFSSPFANDNNVEPNFNFHTQQQPQVQPTAPVQPVQQAQSQVKVLSSEEVDKIVQDLRVSMMTNPVKIVEPSYILTETQMKNLLSIAQGKSQQQVPQPQYVPPQYYPPQPPPQPIMYNPYVYPMAQPVKEKGFFDKILDKAKEPQGGNMIDTIGNATFGTVGRIGHTITGVIDGVVDVLTLGYGSRRY